MTQSVLLTGVSGYLGGTLLAHLKTSNFPDDVKFYALVRTKEQQEAVKKYGVEPVLLDLTDINRAVEFIVNEKINVIYFLIDALKDTYQIPMIKALGEVKKQTGQEVHFLHTSGAKIFSEHAAHPIDKPFPDTDAKLYDIQKNVKPANPYMTEAVATNNNVIDTAEAYGVRSYIFIPCIVYGEGGGFGNPISIQTVSVVRAAMSARRVWDVNPKNSTWPVCHVQDNTTYYIALLKAVLAGDNPGYGKNGYYLAASGSVDWHDIYVAMAKALAKHRVVDSDLVEEADDAALEKMAEGLKCPKEFVAWQLGGKCALEADHGKELGWKPQYAPKHILDVAEEEVDHILKSLKALRAG